MENPNPASELSQHHHEVSRVRLGKPWTERVELRNRHSARPTCPSVCTVSNFVSLATAASSHFFPFPPQIHFPPNQFHCAAPPPARPALFLPTTAVASRRLSSESSRSFSINPLIRLSCPISYHFAFRRPPAHFSVLPAVATPSDRRSLHIPVLRFSIMLMQSAMPCEGRRYLTRSHSRAFSPTPPPGDGYPGGTSLLGTCRALQSLLSGSPSASPNRPRSARLQSPLHLVSTPTRSPAKTTSSPQTNKARKQQSTRTPPTRTRGARKRSRSIYEDGDGDVDMMRSPRDRFSTPKRQKRCPPDMPLGLAITDFEALDDNEQQISFGQIDSPMCTLRQRRHLQQTPQIITQDDDDVDARVSQTVLPSIEEPDNNNNNNSETDDDRSEWTAEDDQRLVDVVLDKLQLSKRDWEECTRLIGKDDDSISRRWRILVGEGNIGLRRGRDQFPRRRIEDCFPEAQ